MHVGISRSMLCWNYSRLSSSSSRVHLAVVVAGDDKERREYFDGNPGQRLHNLFVRTNRCFCSARWTVFGRRYRTGQIVRAVLAVVVVVVVVAVQESTPSQGVVVARKWRQCVHHPVGTHHVTHPYWDDEEEDAPHGSQWWVMS